MPTPITTKVNPEDGLYSKVKTNGFMTPKPLSVNGISAKPLSSQSPVVKPQQVLTPTASAPKPIAQSSYQGGQSMPAIGTPEYNQAQSLASKPTPVQAPTAQPQQQGVPGFYQGALQGLSAIGSQPNPLVYGAYGSLTNAAQQNFPLGQRAMNIANEAGQKIADIGQIGARSAAGYATTGTSPVAEGNAAIQRQTTAAQQQAVAQGAQTALQGTQQALTGLGQAQSGFGAAGQLGATNQGQQISALQGTATAAAPTTQFGVLTSPVTGQPIAPGMTPGSAAFQGGYIGGQQQAGVTAAQMNVANIAAKGIEGTIQQYLASNPQLNASPVTIANAAQQWIQGKQLGDPAYQTLFNYLNEYISTLAPILGVGGDTTNLKTQIAQSFVNAQASGESISQVLDDIGRLAEQKLANIVSAGQGGGQVAGGNIQSSTPSSFGSEW